MPRLFIVDPSLKDIRGHHYMMTQGATLSAQENGYEVTWLCSKEFTDELENDQVSIEPTFGASMYQNYLAKMKAASARKRSWFDRLFRKPAPAAPTICLTTAFYDDLVASFEKHAINENDRIFLHTGDGASFSAIARMITTMDKSRLPIFHVATPYDPVGVMPNLDTPDSVADAIESVNKAGLIDKKLFLYAENSYLADHLTSLWGLPVRTLNVPAYAPNGDIISRSDEYRSKTLGLSDDTFMIVSLGSARVEKGFHLIPEIIKRSFEIADTGVYERVDSTNIKYVLHASPQIVGRAPEIIEALGILNAMPNSQVELLLDPLSEVDYKNLLYASNIVLMPYSEHAYRVRGSAIVSESIASGKTIVATPGSYPGKAASRFGGETGALPIEMAHCILKIASDKLRYKTHAENISVDYLAQNKIKNYWKKCIETEAAARVKN